ncbi:unnamed protein product [Dicrocoelium dendriticum]|nr:unnamed protein product [Dicrocoelium dendriticum]
MPTDLPPSVSKLPNSVSKSDLLSISVYANSARVRLMSEGEQMNIFNLLASIGGIFGLYVGLSGVTVFEVLEALFLIIISIPVLCRTYGRSVRLKGPVSEFIFLHQLSYCCKADIAFMVPSLLDYFTQLKPVGELGFCSKHST